MGGGKCSGDDGLVGLVEMNVGHAVATPASSDGREGLWLFCEEGLLLLGRELEDSTALLLAVERGEDLVVETEVGMVYVCALDGSFKAEGEFAEEDDLLSGFGHDDVLPDGPPARRAGVRTPL